MPEPKNLPCAPRTMHYKFQSNFMAQPSCNTRSSFEILLAAWACFVDVVFWSISRVAKQKFDCSNHSLNGSFQKCVPLFSESLPGKVPLFGFHGIPQPSKTCRMLPLGTACRYTSLFGEIRIALRILKHTGNPECASVISRTRLYIPACPPALTGSILLEGTLNFANTRVSAKRQKAA